MGPSSSVRAFVLAQALVVAATSTLRVAHCVTGAARRLAMPAAQALLRDTVIEGLGGEASVFLLVHGTDDTYNGRRRGEKRKQTAGAVGAVDGFNESIGRREGRSSRALAFGEVVRDSSCKNPRARAGVNCCGLRGMRWHVSVGPLMHFWIDECFARVAAYEETHKRRFDWVTRIRPDLACAGALPNLETLDATAVHALAKENRCMWDTLFLIPRGYFDSFREASFGGIYAKQAPLVTDVNGTHCPGNPRQPEMTQFARLTAAGIRVRVHVAPPWHCFLLVPNRQDTLRGCERRLTGRGGNVSYGDFRDLIVDQEFCDPKPEAFDAAQRLCDAPAVQATLDRIYNDDNEEAARPVPHARTETSSQQVSARQRRRIPRSSRRFAETRSATPVEASGARKKAARTRSRAWVTAQQQQSKKRRRQKKAHAAAS